MPPTQDRQNDSNNHATLAQVGDANPRPRQPSNYNDVFQSSLTRSVSWLNDDPTPPPARQENNRQNTTTGRSSAMDVNEATPIISNSHRSGTSPITQRNYQSTDSLPRRDRYVEASSDEENDSRQQRQQRQRSGKSNDANNTQNNTASTEDNGGDDDDDDDARQPWHRRIADKYGALELDNKGSVARDHLALERTFLAWLRTSLAFASIGIAVTQLFRLNSSISGGSADTSLSTSQSPPLLPVPIDDSSSSLLELLLAPATNDSNTGVRLRNVGKPLGATFIAIAILILLIGFHRYFEAQYWIIRGKFPASRGSVALVTFLAAGLIVASLVVILAIAPTALER